MSAVRPVARSRAERQAQALDDAMQELRSTGSVRVPGSSTRPWLLWIGCTALGLGGLGMALGPLTSLPFGSDPRDTPFHVAIGIAALICFGVLGTWLMPRYVRRVANGLIIDHEGVRVPAGSAVPWSSIVAVHRARGRRAVTLIVRGRAQGPENGLGEAAFAMRTGHSAVVLPPARSIAPDGVAALLAEGRRLSG